MFNGLNSSITGNPSPLEDLSAARDQAPLDLAELKQLYPEKSALILFIEVTPIQPADREATLKILTDYIRENRLSNDEDDLTAMGSAIRKLLMNIEHKDLDSVSFIFEDGRHEMMDPISVMEVAKAVCHHLTFAHPSEAPNTAPRLADQLMDVLRLFGGGDTPTIPKDGVNGAILANCTQALALLGSDHLPDVCRFLETLDSESSWFLPLLETHTRETLKHISESFGSADQIVYIDGIQQLYQETRRLQAPAAS